MSLCSVHMQCSVRVRCVRRPFVALLCGAHFQHSPALPLHHLCTNKSPRQASRRSRNHLWCLVPAGHCCTGKVCLLGPEGIAVLVVRPQGHHLCVHLRAMWCTPGSGARMKRGKVAGERPDREGVQAQPGLGKQGNEWRRGTQARNEQVARSLRPSQTLPLPRRPAGCNPLFRPLNESYSPATNGTLSAPITNPSLLFLTIKTSRLHPPVSWSTEDSHSPGAKQTGRKPPQTGRKQAANPSLLLSLASETSRLRPPCSSSTAGSMLEKEKRPPCTHHNPLPPVPYL